MQGYIEDHGRYGILTNYVGHGIGQFHARGPTRVQLPGQARQGPEVKPGLVVAIEPMVVTRRLDTHVKDDDWTVATDDGLAAAHWEHSVAVHKDGIWVLTAEDGGASGLQPQFGITPTPSPERSHAKVESMTTPLVLLLDPIRADAGAPDAAIQASLRFVDARLSPSSPRSTPVPAGAMASSKPSASATVAHGGSTRTSPAWRHPLSNWIFRLRTSNSGAPG